MKTGYKLTQEHNISAKQMNSLTPTSVENPLIGKKRHSPWNKGISTYSIEVKCQECGKSFKAWRSSLNRGRGKYCNIKCKIKAETIYKFPPDETLVHRLREIKEYKQWRMDCLRRDWFKCQECGSKERLEVHHIKPFRKLVVEFIKEYDQFSVIEDIETLIRLATKYSPFWNIDNGVIYCKKCHGAIELNFKGRSYDSKN